MLCYIIFWFINRLSSKKEIYKTMIMVGIFIILGIYYFTVQDGLRFEQMIAFPIGVIVAKYDLFDKWKLILKNERKSGIIVTLFFLIAFIALIAKQGTYARMNFRIYMIFDFFIKLFAGIAIILTLFSIYYKNHDNVAFTVLEKIGGCSYAIYLVHGYALNIFGLSSNIMLNYVFFFVITFIISVMSNYAFGYVQNFLKNRLQIP